MSEDRSALPDGPKRVDAFEARADMLRRIAESRGIIATMMNAGEVPVGFSDLEAWAFLGLRQIKERKKPGPKTGSIRNPRDEMILDVIETAMKMAECSFDEVMPRVIKLAIKKEKLSGDVDRTTYPRLYRRKYNNRLKMRANERELTREQAVASIVEALMSRDIIPPS